MLWWRGRHGVDPGARLTAASHLRFLGARVPGEPLLDTAISRALLQGVAEGRLAPSLRIYRPDEVLAFSILDRAAAGFAAAVAAARSVGFSPVVRLAGGRAALFHEETVSFAWSRPVGDLRDGIDDRYREMGAILVEALQSLGVDARVGEIEGEYCPGRYSVNVGGRRKLAGVGQRVIRGAAHVGGVLVVRHAARVNEGLLPVYRALGVAMRPEATGAVEDERPGTTTEEVIRALQGAFARRFALESVELDAETLARARSLVPEHDPDRARPGGAVRALPGVPKGVME